MLLWTKRVTEFLHLISVQTQKVKETTSQIDKGNVPILEIILNEIIQILTSHSPQTQSGRQRESKKNM